jgi:hypothetical protein
MKFCMRILSALLATVGLRVVLAGPAIATFPGKNGKIALILEACALYLNPANIF